MLELEKEGYAAMHTCAFVLVQPRSRCSGGIATEGRGGQVAGGLGERLGYSGIKVALPAEITTGGSFLKWAPPAPRQRERRGGADGRAT